jgi:asparagine synthase (glutamine-hydrolysing)
MCGICGKVDRSGVAVDPSLLRRMAATLQHRGPDDEGVRSEPSIGLAQRRLAIVDLDKRATAPLANEDGTIWVTFNGEIYNFAQLRQELVDTGHRFRTTSDTEVLVHLYEEEGVDCLARLRGMFAFALWDRPRRRLFAARDRLGKKPFYYATPSSGLVFGSEIKAILADPCVSVSPSYGAIREYLRAQYVPSPLTAFAGIWKLPAAHWLTFDLDGGLHVERYWDLPDDVIDSDSTELEAQLLDHLRDAVRLRLSGDVPVGALLSGGVDSSAVVALMAEASSGSVQTFSIGFGEPSHDETPYARMVAERYGTDHRELVVTPDALDVLPRLVWHYNEPFADASALPTYYVSQLTRSYVKVVLSGDGGDETFGGYDNYGRVLAWGTADMVPSWLRRPVGEAVVRGLAELPYNDTLARASRAARMLAGTPSERFALQTSIFKPEEEAAAFTPAFQALMADDAVPASEGASRTDARSDLDLMMRHDLRHYLPDCLMTKVDVASMAHGLEVRSPLLDHRLVEFASRIPSHLKRDHRGGKGILKRALREYLPDPVLNRPKQGFGVPVGAWFRGPLSAMLRETLLDGRAERRGLFEPGFVRRAVDDHVAGRRDWSSRLWALVFLELWFREFVDS